MSLRIRNIAVIGNGGWGTTLAIHLARKGYEIRLWGAFPEDIREIKHTRFNAKFLPGIKIPHQVILEENLQEAIVNAQVIVLATPSQYISSVLKQIKKCDLSGKIFLSVIKGIDPLTLRRMSEVIYRELGRVRLAVLSGPNIAGEVARGIPSTAVIASQDRNIAGELQKLFHSPTFRIYTNSDVVGVEMGGSLKNVIAIACGVCDGLGFGTNTKAALLTRGLAEIARLGIALGARRETFAGLSGLGDLVTTCYNQQSRNRSVGEELGKGKRIRAIVSSMNTVAEGVPTVKAAYQLAKKYKVSVPVTTEVFKIIYKHKNPKTAVKDLMTRKIKPE